MLNSKLILLLLTLAGFLFISCNDPTFQKLPRVHKRSGDNSPTADTCDSLKFLLNLDFDGKSIHSLAKCISYPETKGGKVLNGTLKLMNTFGVDGVTKLLDFAKINPENDDDNSFPLLKALSIMMERGTYSKNGYDQNKIDTRYGPLQEYLKNTKLELITKLMFDMNRTGTLKAFLDELPFILDKVHESSYFALSRSYMLRDDLRKSFVKSITVPLNKPHIYQAVKNIFTLEDSKTVDKENMNECLMSWLNPRTNGDKDRYRSSNVTCSMSTSDDTPTLNGKERYNNFLNTTSESDITKLTKAITHLSKEIITMDSSERLGVIKRLAATGSRALMEQAWPLKNTLALSNLLRNKKASNLTFAMDTLKEIIDNPDAGAVRPFNIKIGSSKLHEIVENKLTLGGKIPGCSGLVLTGLQETVERYNKQMNIVFAQMAKFLSPNRACNYNLPPLASIILTTLETELDCKNAEPSDNYDRYCPTNEELSALADEFKSDEWEGVTKFTTTDPALLRNLLITTLKETRAKLEMDPFHLHFKHFAQGKVPLSIFDEIVNLVDSTDSLTAQKIAIIEKGIEKSNIYSKHFMPNLLENLLHEKIEQISSTADEFSGLVEKKSDRKMLRVFTGVYNHGPLEQLFHNESYINKFDSTPNDSFRVKELLARLRETGALFENARLDSEETYFTHYLLGTKYRGIKFSDSGFKFAMQKPLKTKNILSGYLRTKTLLKYGKLIAKDVLASDSKDFYLWANESLYDHYSNESFWNETANEKTFAPISTEFLDTTEYSQVETRKIALYYSLNYLSAPSFFPEEGSYEINPEKHINKQFYTLATSKNSAWSSYLHFFPKLLSSNKTETLAEVFNNLFKDMTEEDYVSLFSSDIWNFSLDKSKNVFKHTNSVTPKAEEIVKLLTTLNLLTKNKAKDSKTVLNSFQPIISTNTDCWDKAGSKINCPITISNTTDKFATLKKFIFEHLLVRLCPYIADTTNDFSSNFKANMRSKLGLNIENSNYTDFCSDSSNNLDMQSYIPDSIQERVISDILKVGKNPKLKPGLTTLAAQIRFYKLNEKYPINTRLMVQKWVNSFGMLTPEAQNYAQKMMSDTKGFLTFKPGMINVYFNYISKKVSEFNIVENALNIYGAEKDPSNPSDLGIAHKFLTDVVLTPQKKAADDGKTALFFILEAAKVAANNPEYLDILTKIVSYPDDMESMLLLAKAMPLFTDQLNDSLPENEVEFWSKPETYMLKQFIRQENLRQVNDLYYLFTPNELYSGLSAFLKAYNMLGSTSQIYDFASKIITYLSNGLIATVEDKDKVESVIESVEGSLIVLAHEKYTNDYHYAANHILTAITEQHIGFDLKPATAIIDTLESFTHYMFTRSATLFEIYQNHFKQSEQDLQDDYLKEILLDYIYPIAQDEGALGSKAFASLIEDPRIGTWNGLYKPIITNKKYQNDIFEIITLLDRLEAADYLNAVDDMDSIFERSGNLLEIVANNSEWKSTTSKDVIYNIEATSRLSQEGSELWDLETTVLRKWLGDF